MAEITVGQEVKQSDWAPAQFRLALVYSLRIPPAFAPAAESFRDLLTPHDVKEL